MPAIKRITLNQAQAGSPFGQRLINQLLAMGHDGDLSLEEVTALHTMLKSAPQDVNAVEFLRTITTSILADGCLDEVEVYELRRAMERVVPKSVRMRLTEMLSGIGLPSKDDDDPATQSHDWRGDPITAKQLEYIRALGGHADSGMTKGQASSMIDQLLERRPPTPRQHMLLRFYDRLDLRGKTKEEVSVWIDSLYMKDEAYERAWHLFKTDMGDDGSLRDPEAVPIGAYREYMRVRVRVVQEQVPKRRVRWKLALAILVVAVVGIVVLVKCAGH